MSENVNNLNEVTNEVTNEVQPVPETMNYEQVVSFTDKFVNDLIESLQDFSYAETHQLINVVKDNRNGVPISVANEILGRVASFPWRAVNGLMNNINSKQDEYFVFVNAQSANN